MIKMIMHGYLGKMGRYICEMAEKHGCEVVAGIDALTPSQPMPFPTFTNVNDCDMPADVILDFSTASAVPALMDFAVSKNLPIVVCTTGLSELETGSVLRASEKIAVFKSYNMSLGVNLLINVIEKAAKILNEVGFDIEIIEKHHDQKTDAPSGTAFMLADAINERLGNKFEYVYDRSTVREKRGSNEIGIHSIRGGTIVGEHTVIFAGNEEVMEFTHSAYSKNVFAVGALKAVKFMKGKPPGLYEMKHIMNEL